MNEEDALALLAGSGCPPGVIRHARAVAGHARRIALDIKKSTGRRGTDIDIDVDAVFTGGLLHDIGRSKTNGIDHAVEGARIAVERGLSAKLVNIIERHIGAGITKDEAEDLGLPAKDYLPVTIEEKIVAHADNLVSGSRVITRDELVADLKSRNMDEKVIQRIIKLDDEIRALSS